MSVIWGCEGGGGLIWQMEWYFFFAELEGAVLKPGACLFSHSHLKQINLSVENISNSDKKIEITVLDCSLFGLLATMLLLLITRPHWVRAPKGGSAAPKHNVVGCADQQPRV